MEGGRGGGLANPALLLGLCHAAIGGRSDAAATSGPPAKDGSESGRSWKWMRDSPCLRHILAPCILGQGTGAGGGGGLFGSSVT